MSETLAPEGQRYEDALEQVLHDLRLCKNRDDVHEADDGPTLTERIRAGLAELGIDVPRRAARGLDMKRLGLAICLTDHYDTIDRAEVCGRHDEAAAEIIRQYRAVPLLQAAARTTHE